MYVFKYMPYLGDMRYLLQVMFIDATVKTVIQ